jgi:hypothetical protein
MTALGVFFAIGSTVMAGFIPQLTEEIYFNNLDSK